MFEDAHGLAPIQMLHINISHTLQQLDTPGAVGAALLRQAQGSCVGLASHIQFGQAVINIRQVQVFANGLIHLAIGSQLVDQTGAGR